MPPFLDPANLRRAIDASALPALERLADNPDRLDASLDRRFERDDPPPYASESEDEAEVALYHPVLAGSADAALEKFHSLVSEPLNDDDVVNTLYWLQPHAYAPSSRYKQELEKEDRRIDGFAFQRGLDPKLFWKGPRADQRRAVIARRNIKRRWQRLGVWNPGWGIPGRINPQPQDEIGTWQWAWESSPDWRFSKAPANPVRRALELRRNMAYPEHAPPPPRSCLRADSSVSESESFITSRPWFVYQLEGAEFMTRQSRIPVQQRGRRNPGEDGPTTRRWKERGDWEPGWKWRHESPEPEEEDLTPILTDEMEYTPSEVDALEAIPPPSPTPSPRRFSGPIWKPAKGSLFGGPLSDSDTSEDDEPPLATDEPEAQGVPGDDEPPAAVVEPEDQAMSEPEEQPPNPPPRRRGRPRKQSQPSKAVAEPAAAPPPPPRRSARIAEKTADPPPAAPGSRATARTRKARGHPASPPPPPRNPSPAASVPKKRGRPRKTQDGAVAKPAAPAASKRGRKAGNSRAAKAAVASAAAGTAAAGKRPRGRPRRTE